MQAPAARLRPGSGILFMTYIDICIIHKDGGAWGYAGESFPKDPRSWPEVEPKDADALSCFPSQVSCSTVQALLAPGKFNVDCLAIYIEEKIRGTGLPKNRGKILSLPQCVIWWEEDRSQPRSRGPNVTLRCWMISWMSGQGWSVTRTFSKGNESTPMERKTGSCSVLNSCVMWCANFFMMAWASRTGQDYIFVSGKILLAWDEYWCGRVDFQVL